MIGRTILCGCTVLLFLAQVLDWQALARSDESSCHDMDEGETAQAEPMQAGEEHWPGSKSCDCDADCECDCRIPPSLKIGEVRRIAEPPTTAHPVSINWPVLACHSKDLHFRVLKVPIGA
jgi:hypothetical protein